MSEILFKAKQTKTGEWIEGFYLSDNNLLPGTYICPKLTTTCKEKGEMLMGGFIPVVPATVCRYTGLPDCDGVKIFEGDLVEAGYYKWKCRVVWDEDCARFICFTTEGERRIVYVDMVDKAGNSVLRVIGSIHDKKPTPEH